MELIEKDWDKYATIKVTGISYCQSCGKEYEGMSIVYFAPLDNNIICKECSKVHTEVHPRLFIK